MIIYDGDFRVEIWHDIDEDGIYDIEFYLYYDGNKYFGWAFTLNGIKYIMEKNKLTGEDCGGIYFWATDFIIIEKINKDVLINALKDIVSSKKYLSEIFSIID